MVFLFIFLIISILLITSKIQINIDKLKLKKNHLNHNYKISIKLLILSKIPIVWLNIDKNKVEKIKESNRLQKINFNFNNMKKNLSIKKIGDAKNQINIQIKKFRLNIAIGSDSTVLTTLIVPLVSTIISIILARKKVKPSNWHYEIKPIYNSRKFIKSYIFRYI